MFIDLRRQVLRVRWKVVMIARRKRYSTCTVVVNFESLAAETTHVLDHKLRISRSRINQSEVLYIFTPNVGLYA